MKKVEENIYYFKCFETQPRTQRKNNSFEIIIKFKKSFRAETLLYKGNEFIHNFEKSQNNYIC